ncbi:MAG: hypothetical protein Aurels2KO_25710 [Aureliella sp.]
MVVLIREVRYVDVELDELAQQRVDKCKKGGLCVACLGKLDPEQKSPRGMHPTCHATTWRYIRDGVTTEEARVRAGKMLPANKGGRPPSNPVSKELAGKS